MFSNEWDTWPCQRIRFWLSLTEIRYRDQTLKQWSFPMLTRPCYFSSEPFKLEELRQSLFDSSIALKYRMNSFSPLVNIFSVSLMIYACSRQQNLPRQHQRQPEQQAQNRISFANGINNSGRCKWYRKSTSTNNCDTWLRGIFTVWEISHTPVCSKSSSCHRRRSKRRVPASGVCCRSLRAVPSV